MNNIIKNTFIIDDIIDKDNLEKSTADIKYLLDFETQFALMDYNLVDLNTLNKYDKLILLKKTTLKIIGNSILFEKYDDKFIYFTKSKNENSQISKEVLNNIYVFYKHAENKKNMMQYLLDGLNNNTLKFS